MRAIKVLLLIIFILFFSYKDLHAQQMKATRQDLDKKQQIIVVISAFTAIGDMVQLPDALAEGLNAGLTVSEIKEILVQLYAYAGFPRSLNALNNFMNVLKERKSQGISDPPGKVPSQLPSDKSRLQIGTELQTKLVGKPIQGEVFQFAPAIDQFLKEHLFGDIFGRDNLDWKSRELATISALASLGNVESQLQSHFRVGVYNGLSKSQLNQLVTIIQTRVSLQKGEAASRDLHDMFKQSP